MSSPSSCCTPCCDETQIVNVPGISGADGIPGTDGTDGVNAYSVTTADFVVPALSGAVSVGIANTSWLVVGQIIYIQNAGAFEVDSITDSTHAILTYLPYSININSGNTISAGAGVSPSGNQITVSGITSFTDATGGVASDTLAAGVGKTTLSFYIEAASIANGDLLTEYVPGYKFKILKFDARCAKTVSTGAKAANLNLEIGTTNLTGGVIALSGTYAIGAAQAGTTISGANTGSETDSISIEASSTTAFVEGAFWLILSIANMDTVDAVASLADKTNDLLAALA